VTRTLFLFPATKALLLVRRNFWQKIAWNHSCMRILGEKDFVVFIKHIVSNIWHATPF
jgi:hypothetical protein